MPLKTAAEQGGRHPKAPGILRVVPLVKHPFFFFFKQTPGDSHVQPRVIRDERGGELQSLTVTNQSTE